MNIKITHSWLLEYLETDATPEEIRKYLSLCGPSVEKVDRIDDDYVYDIEITSNRVDSASVMGIAREAAAILPRFGKKAVYKKNNSIKKPANSLLANNLTFEIIDRQNLSKRTMAVILEGVKIKDSPGYIRKRLEAIGIRSLNNLVDITNYVMVETGHPAHIFDYDRIKTGKFIIRKAQAGEKLITLDKKTFILKGDEIIFDDGTGRIVDLPSIMGTENSVVTDKSERVMFFIDNIDSVLVRKASMSHGIRTVAATYNEKDIDPELVKVAFDKGYELLLSLAEPKSVSKIIDFYPNPKPIHKIEISTNFINSRIGITIAGKEIESILNSLQFKISKTKDKLTVTPPSFRSKDIQIQEDIVEEVARIYGYHNLPNNVQPTVYVKQPGEIDLLFELQSKIKHFLKHLGLHEVMNYSMISEKTIINADLKVEDHLILKNTISEEIQYLRSHILPSLYQNIKNNEGKAEVLKFFEIAKTYKKRKGDLPFEEYKLGVAVNTSYSDLKGIIDALLQELNITDYETRKTNYEYFANNTQAEITPMVSRLGRDQAMSKSYLVRLGQMNKKYQSNFGIKKDSFVAVVDLKTLMNQYRPLAHYSPISSFAVIKLDHTFENRSYEELKKVAFKSKLLQKLEVISVFKNKLTLRFFYNSQERNITEEEAKKELSLMSLP